MGLKVNICGAPSSRKSTVCAGLEAKLKQQRINAETSKEYVRQYIQTYGVPQELATEFIIYHNQMSRDIGVANNTDVMLSDTPAVNAYIFGKRSLMAKMARQERKTPTEEEYKILEELHSMALRKLHWFDLIVLFPPTMDVIDDGVRTETVEDQVAIFNAIKGFLDAEQVPYLVAEGTPDEKIDYCFGAIMSRLFVIPDTPPF